MEKKLNTNYLAILICLAILVIAGIYFVYAAYLPPEDLDWNQRQNPGSPNNLTGPGPLESPGFPCDPQSAASHIPVPVDTSVPIRDPMPGIRYSLNESESGRTLVLAKGDVVEINLRWTPSLAMRWFIPVSGCGIELVNDGYYNTGTDFWNMSGLYRARYKAVSPGTSILDGKFVITPNDRMNAATPTFNLTVIVK